MTIGLVGVAISLVARRFPGRHFRLLRRLDRRLHPAHHRLYSVAADHPPLVGVGCRPADHLGAAANLLRHHHHPVVHRLDGAGASGARAFSGAAHRGFRHGGAAGWCQPDERDLRAHAPGLLQPHHRVDHAGRPADDSGRDGTQLSWGWGLRPPVVSWGVLLQDAQNVRAVATAPWLLIPAVGVVVSVLALNFLGDGLRDAADPYMH